MSFESFKSKELTINLVSPCQPNISFVMISFNGGRATSLWLDSRFSTFAVVVEPLTPSTLYSLTDVSTL